jgi:hypothetical protein
MAIDDLLDKQDWGYEYLMSDYATSKESEQRYEREGKAKIAEFKQALYKDMLELIGEDTTWNQQEAYTNPDTVQGYNEALSDMRDKLKEYFNAKTNRRMS